MVEGIIHKLLGGFYYVFTDGEIWCCRARGLFRNENIKPLVGDKVLVQPDSLESHKGYIIEVLPRETELVRPAVANVNQAVIVFSLTSPKPNLPLLDKLLIFCEMSGVEPLICFNKSDLDDNGVLFAAMKAIYQTSGYHVIETSTKVEHGKDALIEALTNRISVFAGPSGVGKSSLVNNIIPGLQLITGEVSEKIQRGKHTTRHTELIALPFGGFVLDTPGFTSLELDGVTAIELKDLMPDFVLFQEECRFDDCQHVNEPGCAVLEALAQGKIHESRYTSYQLMLKQLVSDRRKKSW